MQLDSFLLAEAEASEEAAAEAAAVQADKYVKDVDAAEPPATTVLAEVVVAETDAKMGVVAGDMAGETEGEAGAEAVVSESAGVAKTAQLQMEAGAAAAGVQAELLHKAQLEGQFEAAGPMAEAMAVSAGLLPEVAGTQPAVEEVAEVVDRAAVEVEQEAVDEATVQSPVEPDAVALAAKEAAALEPLAVQPDAAALEPVAAQPPEAAAVSAAEEAGVQVEVEVEVEEGAEKEA